MEVASKTEKVRVQAWLKPEVKQIADLAASRLGITLTQLITQALIRESKSVNDTYQTLKLDFTQTQALMKALEVPPHPSGELLDAVANYRKTVVSDAKASD